MIRITISKANRRNTAISILTQSIFFNGIRWLAVRIFLVSFPEQFCHCPTSLIKILNPMQTYVYSCSLKGGIQMRSEKRGYHHKAIVSKMNQNGNE